MHIIPIADPGLGNTSYLVDLGDGSGLVIDPGRDPRPYLAAAESHGLRIRHVAETHLHADFVSGSRELVALGAELLAPSDAELAFPHTPVRDGSEHPLGDLQLSVVATPGHTPEHVSYLLSDDGRPVSLFSGGTLMDGGVARPDLVSADLTVPLARSAYRSVRSLFESLPDDVTLHPTHGAGSFCSAGSIDRGSVSTLGSQRSYHPALLAADEDAFVADLLGELGTFPPYFLRLRPVNQAGPTIYGVDLPALTNLDVAELDRLLELGATIVDARPIARFSEGHIPGSISNELRDHFGTWLGWVVEPDTPLVMIVDSDQDERELVRHALTVGYEDLAGKFDLGAWTSADRKLNAIALIEATDIDSDAPILDVRQHNEYEAGHVDGAMHVELGALRERPSGSIPAAVVHCGHGQRAMTGASLLARAGVVPLGVTRAGVEEIAKSR